MIPCIMILDDWQIYNHEQDKAIEKAVMFFCDHYKASNINPKPVLIHSIRVATLLDIYNADYKIVIAAILHDIIEDTACTAEEIAKEFGEEIVALVQAGSFDPTITDYTEKYKEHFDRLANNYDALLIKTADILDNRRYIGLGNPEKLNAKHKYFVEIAKPLMQNHPLFLRLATAVNP